MTSLTLHCLEDTERLARALADIAGPGLVVLLDGPVGTGKTTLARATIQELMHRSGGHVEDVPSPTFTLVQTYDLAKFDIWHADLYRLTSADELIELGLEQAFETSFCLIEWPDRMGELAPQNALSVHLQTDPSHPDQRHVSIKGTDPRKDTWLDGFGRQAA